MAIKTLLVDAVTAFTSGTTALDAALTDGAHGTPVFVLYGITARLWAGAATVTLQVGLFNNVDNVYVVNVGKTFAASECDTIGWQLDGGIPVVFKRSSGAKHYDRLGSPLNGGDISLECITSGALPAEGEVFIHYAWEPASSRQA